ncbi:PAS domain S-box protein [Pelagicoccus sp. SDUM812003]|uniref:PAS domain S-box protein n=1 Tax=Pelagicoccus sp. SDUM812003 TaxID=3041267 RepID=UPI00280D8EF2|nr:PAS domain S-box protein [Pelagicoccus sp. SDUM812003]MDQ8204352.1 PAS domain S-box protein [Pelagicoccus sp. SDUM812003]
MDGIGADNMLQERMSEELSDLLALCRSATGADAVWLAEIDESGSAFRVVASTGVKELPGEWVDWARPLLEGLGSSIESVCQCPVSEVLSAESGMTAPQPLWRRLAAVRLVEATTSARAALLLGFSAADPLSPGQREEAKRSGRLLARLGRLESVKSERDDIARQRDLLKERFADAERIANFGHWVLGLDDGRLSWSDEVYRIFGVEPQSFGQTFESFLSFVHPEDRPALLEAQDRALREESLMVHEHRVVRPDGSIRHVLERGELIPANDMQGRRFAGVVLDITRRKKAELAANREEARHRALFEHLPDLAFVVTDGCIEKINTAGLGLLGVDQAEQIVGRSPLVFVHPEEVEAVSERFAKLVEEAPTIAPHRTVRVVLPKGDVCCFEICSSSFHTPEGSVSIQVVCRDVTRRIELERKEEERSRMMAIASRLARMGAWRVDLEERRVVWSDEVAKIHGREPGYVPSLVEAFSYYAPEDRQRIADAFDRCAQEGQSFDEESSIFDASGNQVRVRAIGLPQRDETGRVVGVQGAFQDITQQKRIEAELRERDRELKRVVERLTTTLESITDAFFTVDTEWKFTYLNGEAERLLQSQRSSLLGQSIWEAFAAARGTAFEEEYRHAVRERASVSFEAYYPPLRSWFEVNAYPSAEGLAVYFRDVTQRRKAEEHMRFLETCVERMNDIVLVTEARPIDEPGPRITFANPAFERLTGYSREEVIGKTPRILQGPLTDREELDRIRDAMRRDQHVRSTVVNYDRKGKAYWLEMDIVPLKDATGEVTRFLAVERDVTESRERQNALQEREQALSALMNGLPGLVFLCAPDGSLVRWNRELERALGYAAEELQGAKALDLSAPEDRERMQERMQQVFRDGFAEATLRLRAKDGTQITFFFRATRVSVEGQARLLGVAMDVTEHRRAEERIRWQAALLDQTQDAIFALSGEGEVFYWNRSAERLYGWSEAEAVGKLRVEDLFAEAGRAKQLMGLVKSDGSWYGEAIQLDRNKRSLTVATSWTLLSQGVDRCEATDVLVVNTDISERKRLEEQYLRVQRMEAIGTLAGGIAHDLNNILSPILLSIDMLKARSTDERDLRTLSTIESAGKRGAAIVKQVLSYARGFGGEQVALVPKHMVNELFSLLKETFPRSIEFSLQLGADIGLIKGDPTQVQQALMNLCVNARDAMPEGGSLSISLEKRTLDRDCEIGGLRAGAGAYVAFIVSDTGQGMTPEVLERIFDPFYSTKGEGKGTGLGLSTVQQIMKAHSGYVQVESTPSGGSSFILGFPALEEKEAPIVPGEDSELPRGKGETLLVVDDEESVRLIAQEMLEDFGYKVLLAENGAKALTLFHRNRGRIDALVTDMMMPVMDGAALIRGARLVEPRLPIIVTTGFTDQASKVKDAEAKGALVLAKPYTAKTILRGLRDVLDRVPS